MSQEASCLQPVGSTSSLRLLQSSLCNMAPVTLLFHEQNTTGQAHACSPLPRNPPAEVQHCHVSTDRRKGVRRQSSQTLVGHLRLSGASRLSLQPSLRPGDPLAAVCPQDSFWKHIAAASGVWAAPWRWASCSNSLLRLGTNFSCF